MSKIDDLIKELCPNGVEWKKLGEVFDMRNGYTPSKANPEFWTNGNIPWFRMEDIRDKGRFLSDSSLHITKSAIKGKGLFSANSFILATTATIGEHALLIVDSLANQRFTNLKICKSLEEKLDVKFMFYYMDIVDRFCKEHTNKSGFESVDMQALRNMDIPLPPLPIQTEIVRILDKFVEQQEQLERLIELRKKQYEYYREEMLKPKEGEKWERKTLGEIGKNLDSKRKPITSSKRKKGPYPYYGASGIVDHVEGFIFDGTYLLISEDGANLITRSTPIAFTIEGKNWVNNHAHVIEIEDYNVRRLVEIYLNSISLEEFISGGAQPKLNQENLNKITIPLPTTEHLSFIIKFLDSFETTITTLTTALELSKKRYEYYRDKMLRF